MARHKGSVAQMLRAWWDIACPMSHNPALYGSFIAICPNMGRFLGLAEMIEILQERGQADDAWQFVDANLKCEPFSVYQIAKEASISIIDLQTGFRFAELYQTFRRRFSPEDHCITLCQHGLRPTSRLLPALNYALMAPFGVAARELGANMEKGSARIEIVSKAALSMMCNLFPAFGASWLTPSELRDTAEKRRLLSIGILCLTDVVVAEMAWQIGFLRAHYQLRDEDIFEGKSPDWSEICADVGAKLLQQVTKYWRLTSDMRT